MDNSRSRSKFVGVYTRTSTKRQLPDGTYDICYEIFYTDATRHIKYEKVGWKSEGKTLEEAVIIRNKRIRAEKELKVEQKLLRKKLKEENCELEIHTKRQKTKYPGVYFRECPKRFHEGKPDRCYDIVWYLGQGKYKWEKVGWRSEGYEENDAIRIRAERIRKHRHPEFFNHINDLTLDEVWEVYRAKHLPVLRESQKFEKRYKNYLQKRFGNKLLSSIKTYEIDSLRIELLLKGLSPAWVKLIMSDLRRIMHKAKRWELYTGDLPNFNMPKVENERLRYFSIQECHDFLLELKLYNCNMYYIAKIEFYTGLRLSEILNLQKYDVDIDKKIIYTDGKTGRHTTYIIDGILNDIEYLISRAKTYLFINGLGKKYTPKYMSSKFSKYISCTNINRNINERKYKYVFHCGRHFFGSLLAEDGISLYTIQKIMGHKDIRSTQRYAKLSQNSLRKALQKFDDSMKNKKN